MECDCLTRRSIPGDSRLFRDFILRSAAAAQFYSEFNPAQPIATLPSHLSALCDSLLAQNRGLIASDATLSNIERLRKGAVAIVTGQQVGLFGGPLYSLLKAITAIDLARHLTLQGHQAVPVFWMATEDHDLAEVRSATFLAGAEGLLTVNADVAGPEGAPVGGLQLTDDISENVERLSSILGPSPALDALASAYAPGATLAQAFGKLFAAIFADHGLILLDPADPSLHSLTADILVRAAEQSQELTSALITRSRELERLGYHGQVNVTASHTLLFALHQGRRVPVIRNHSGFKIAGDAIPQSDLVARIRSRPQDFSGNALLRPVIQDALLPTAAYIGGAAEVAYFAQNQLVYERLLGRVTPILPRMSATLIEPRIDRRMKRYGLALTDLFSSEDELRRSLAARRLPDSLTSEFASAEGSLNDSIAAIEQKLSQLDPSLAASAKTSASKMRYQLGRMKSRAANVLLRRESEIASDVRQLHAALYPHNGLQERTISGAYFLARYGFDLPSRILKDACIRCPDHVVLHL